MKFSFKKFILPLLLFFSFLPAKSTHIVGGDINVQSLGGNNFQVTLTLFFDCINGSPAAFDASITLGVYDKVTNVMQQAAFIPFTDSLRLVLGDSCFIPTTLCVRRQRYIGTIILPNNPNGYYMSWSRCCRNSIINNIITPGASGNVFYCEVPDPAMLDNTPVFTAYPDAYMCVGFPNTDNFSATDADNDSLVYSLVDPYDCATTGICSSVNPLPPNPPAQPGPYGTVAWQAPYVSANMMGDPGQMISNPSGILFTTPPTIGVFVISVKVEEFRNSVKIGEIKRDIQYAVLNCNIPNVVVNGPNPICLGQTTTLVASGGTSYSWSTGATSTSIVVAPTSTGSYNYYVSTSNGLCTALDSIQILVVPGEVITASASDDTVCVGTSVTLNASSTSGNYAWSPASGLSCTNCSNPVATPTATTTYTVIASNGFGCADTAIVTVVTVTTVPAITGNTPICVGQSSTLTASSGVNYSWSTGATTSSIVVTPFAAGSYTFTLTAGVAPCAGTASFVLTVNPVSVATANALNDTICIGSSTFLTATGGGTYLWNTGSSASAISVSPSVTTTYTVIVNAAACPATAVVTVVVMPVPSITASPGDTICVGQDSTQLNALSSTGTYSWVPSTGLSPSNTVSNPWANPPSSQTYTVYVVSANGCSDAAIVSVTVGAIPFISAIASTTICVGDSAVLNSNTSNGQTPYSYFWTPPNTLNNPNIQNPIAGPVTPTNYCVTVVDANGCTDDTCTFVYVQTVPSVTWASWTPDITCEGYVIPLNANVSSNGQYVIWDFGDGTTTTTYAPNTNAGPHLYPFNGTYSITVIVHNPPCKDTVDTTLVVGDISDGIGFCAANVFTPNADNYNNCFQPALMHPNCNCTAPCTYPAVDADQAALLKTCLYLEVYDRWGIKMFETTDTEKCWDGKTLKGKDAKEGTYYYISKLGGVTIRGYITLLRRTN